MGTILKVGEVVVSTYQNKVVNPVPYTTGHVSASYYTPNPNPGTVVSYLLNQLDGATTRVYNQYLEDYARLTVPLLGTGTDIDPYYFYPFPVLARVQIPMVAADFVDKPYVNVLQYFRLPTGVQHRLTVRWYNVSSTLLYTQTGATHTTEDGAWRYLAVNYPAPPQTILNQVTYIYLTLEVMAGMPVTQNYFDVTGFRATPVAANNLDDVRGVYWDGSTTFTQASYVGAWASTPRASVSNLTVTDIPATTEETESVESLSVAEDATGLDASSLSGGTSQATLSIPYTDSADSYMGLGAEVRDTDLGNFYGKVRNLDESTAAGSVTVQMDESMSLLNAWVTAPPMSGTLSTVLRNYVALAEAPVRGFTFEDGTDAITANVPGFVGNLYDKVRELLAAYNAELVTVDGSHVVRATMQDSLALDNFTDDTKVSSNLQDTAQYVRVHYYDNEYVTDGEVFPLGANPQEAVEDIPEPTIYSVGAGEVLNVDIQLRASLLSVNVPVYTAFVPDESVTGAGVYTAVGSDSLPITPSQWAAGGGAISVQISPEDPSILKVTITGANYPALAPFRLAMSSGSGNYYNALHITGTGVFIRDQYVDIPTGALPGATGQRYAVECTNPYISTLTQAYQAGQIVAGRQQQTQGISFSIPTPQGLVVLGLLPGKKFVHGNQQFRIESVDINHHTVSGSGTYALTAADFDRFYTRAAGLTGAQFDALYAGSTPTALNFSLKPLLHRFVEV